MTSPEDDDGLEQALRRALSQAASEVEPESDGLDKIRARIAGRPPRAWPLSVLLGVVERVRNFTWRGHWAWPDWLSRLTEARWPHLRRGNFPVPGFWPLRLAGVLAAAAVITVVAMDIQPVRQAILQASTALHGDSGSTRSIAAPEGNGARTITGGSATPPPSGTAAPGGTGTAPGAADAPGTGKAHPAATTRCAPGGLPAVIGTQSNVKNALPSPAASSPATQSPAPAASTPAASISATPQPSQYTDTPALTCPVSPSPATPTPTPAATSPAPTDTAPSPAASDPADSAPTGSTPASDAPTGGTPASNEPTGGAPTEGEPPSTAVHPPPSRGWSGPPGPPRWPGPGRPDRDPPPGHSRPR